MSLSIKYIVYFFFFFKLREENLLGFIGSSHKRFITFIKGQHSLTPDKF